MTRQARRPHGAALQLHLISGLHCPSAEEPSLRDNHLSLLCLPSLIRKYPPLQVPLPEGVIGCDRVSRLWLSAGEAACEQAHGLHLWWRVHGAALCDDPRGEGRECPRALGRSAVSEKSWHLRRSRRIHCFAVRGLHPAGSLLSIAQSRTEAKDTSVRALTERL